MTKQEIKYQRLDALYSLLPEIKCKKLCAEFCGPIFMTTLEQQRIQESFPNATLPKPMELIQQYMETHDESHLNCPLLNTETKTCSVYELRPMICRIWGTMDDYRMRCPHGCVPENWLQDNLQIFITEQIEHLSS